MTTTSIMVGMAEIHVVKGSGTFSCLGLGSCIGLCILDPISNIGGCAHIMLPEAFADKTVDRPGKFADTGVPELISMMERMGASRSRMVSAIAGGAQVFKFGSGDTGSKLDIGARNIVAVEEQMRKANIAIKAKDVGGNNGRTVLYVVESGSITVRTAAIGEKPLTNLRK